MALLVAELPGPLWIVARPGGTGLECQANLLEAEAQAQLLRGRLAELN